MSKLDTDINKVKLTIKNMGNKLKECGMITSIIPKCLFEDEALIELKDMGENYLNTLITRIEILESEV